MSQITTEITSSSIASDNPIHQRLLFAYQAATSYLHGSVLEAGCGEGRGISTIMPHIAHYTALDKNAVLLQYLQSQYPDYKFIHTTFPPFHSIESNMFDCVVAFQVIEHIADDNMFVKEIHRVLKPGGNLIISTPNRAMSLTRNPWHEREYTGKQLFNLISKYFNNISQYSVTGNEKVWKYYEINKKAVQKITRWDILNAQWWLPAWLLRTPYDYLNRKNRDNMMQANHTIVHDISTHDYYLSPNPDEGFDLFCAATK
ncbi:MAG: methyltransferase domain-containing protein [Cytophagales bacterium]|nr:methyltransferase domain-containing protein [Cytophagales bacterium]